MNAGVTAESVERFLHHFEEVALKEDFGLLEAMIDEAAYFRFNYGDHIGRAAVRAAFEKTWRGDPTVRIQGRGTRVLAFDGGGFRIVREHLSRFPERSA